MNCVKDTSADPSSKFDLFQGGARWPAMTALQKIAEIEDGIKQIFKLKEMEKMQPGARVSLLPNFHQLFCACERPKWPGRKRTKQPTHILGC